MVRIFKLVRASALYGLIGANVAVWVVLQVVALATHAAGSAADVYRWVEVPSAWAELPAHCYGVLTYMFAQFSLLHLGLNMLWLYCFGRIYMEVGTGRRLVRLYLGGGVAGAVVFVLGTHALGLPDSWLIGSSASVIAIVAATAVMMPDYQVWLWPAGAVRVKWVAVATVALVLVTGGMSASSMAHLGGLAAGLLAGAWRRGRLGVNLGRMPSVNLMSLLPRHRRRAPKAPPTPDSDRRELDRILDKIKTSGYGSLSSSEKRDLIDISQRLR